MDPMGHESDGTPIGINPFCRIWPQVNLLSKWTRYFSVLSGYCAICFTQWQAGSCDATRGIRGNPGFGSTFGTGFAQGCPKGFGNLYEHWSICMSNGAIRIDMISWTEIRSIACDVLGRPGLTLPVGLVPPRTFKFPSCNFCFGGAPGVPATSCNEILVSQTRSFIYCCYSMLQCHNSQYAIIRFCVWFRNTMPWNEDHICISDRRSISWYILKGTCQRILVLIVHIVIVSPFSQVTAPCRHFHAPSPSWSTGGSHPPGSSGEISAAQGCWDPQWLGRP